MFFHQRFVPGLAIASYLLGDEKTGEAVVVDPTRDVQPYIDIAREENLHIKYILETHIHADFVCGSLELQNSLSGHATICVSGHGGADWKQPFADRELSEGDRLEVGSLNLEVIHVPGHTPEHIAFVVKDASRNSDKPWFMFTGDFLFVGDVGRPDLLGEDEKQKLANQLYDSVFDKIAKLPDYVEIFPAHGAGSLCGKAIGSRNSSTLGYERRVSEAFKETTREKWIETLLEDMPLSPSYFQRMKKINRDGPALLGSKRHSVSRMPTKEFHRRVFENSLILDVRSKEAFAAAHIPESINIPLGSNLPTWAGWVLPYDRPIVLVLEKASDLGEVWNHLIRVGFDRIEGFLEDGIEGWEQAGYPLNKVETETVSELRNHLNDSRNGRTVVLDVRTEQEWDAGHIEGAVHIHGGEIKERFTEIPKDRPISVVCGSGYRASIASSFLLRNGFDQVSNVMGGMTAWKASDYETVS
ncbi:MAG: MBL fold metallo-hydrolase [Candidatus Omnitrophica bacterium]|nr:MBL fold metallo-hydrolase [Candidatus Omnitrophota bacterium]